MQSLALGRIPCFISSGDGISAMDVHGLDNLLLHGEVYDQGDGYWVKIEAWQVSAENTFRTASATRLPCMIGRVCACWRYDNAHAVSHPSAINSPDVFGQLRQASPDMLISSGTVNQGRRFESKFGRHDTSCRGLHVDMSHRAGFFMCGRVVGIKVQSHPTAMNSTDDGRPATTITVMCGTRACPASSPAPTR